MDEVCPKRAVIYLRVAREDRNQVQALAFQRHACQRRANELNLMMLGEYVDRGSNNVNPEHRPGLSRLLAELRERPVAYVVTFNSARIAHKAYHFASVAWRLGKLGTRLEIASVPHSEVDEQARQLISYIGSVQLVDPELGRTDK
ncbi:recombinase family protein [Amycolatopsis sp. NPDC004747]